MGTLLEHYKTVKLILNKMTKAKSDMSFGLLNEDSGQITNTWEE